MDSTETMRPGLVTGNEKRSICKNFRPLLEIDELPTEQIIFVAMFSLFLWERLQKLGPSDIVISDSRNRIVPE